MSDSESQNYEYQLGGSLSPDAPSYVTRKADDDLYQALMSGRYCYALNSRQMGKSSLRVRTGERLKEKGIDCATLDIAGITSEDIKPNDWYFGVAYTLGSELKLFNEFSEIVEWWENRELLPPAQRLADYIDLIVLEKIRKSEQHHIVVFVDEIDSLFKLTFGDDFFDLIRNCHGKRAVQKEYRRLTFALMGVADPADLVKDKRRPPFNIGEAIILTGFRFNEARQSLTHGLMNKSRDPDRLLQAILSWTEGQPFLTQKICDLVANESSSPAAGDETSWLSRLIQEQIVNDWEEHDKPVHFRPIQDRILYNKNQRTGRLLGLYQSILRGEDVEADSSLDQMELRLAGLVVVKDQKIRVSNPIYKAIFDDKWVEKRLSELRPYSEVLRAWLESKRQDDSRLLRGQALKAANEWAAGKKLSDEDYEFLAASEKLKTEGIERALNVEEQKKTILLAAKQRADTRVRIGGAILALTLIVSGFAAVYGMRSVDRAKSELQAAQRNVDSKRKELEDVKTDANTTQSRLNNATSELQKAQNSLKTITPELKQKQEELINSKTALEKLQTTLGSTKTQLENTRDLLKGVTKQLSQSEDKLNSTSEKLKLAETSLENKEFDTYVLKLRSDRPYGRYGNSTSTYVKELVEILKDRGPQYSKRRAVIEAEIQEYRFLPPEFRQENLKQKSIREWNRVYQMILYRATGDSIWKKKLFDSFREEAKELESDRGFESFYSLTNLTRLMDWDETEQLELALLAADLILNYKLQESSKTDLFSAIWQVNLGFDYKNTERFVENNPRQFVDLIKIARDIMRARKQSAMYSGARTFLEYLAPQAFLIYAADFFTNPTDSPADFRTEILRDVQTAKNIQLKKATCPDTDDAKAWEAWLASNSQMVALWNEPELTTLRNNVALLKSQVSLWR